jgi:hypothetical protein
LEEGGCGAYYPPNTSKSSKDLPSDRPSNILVVIPGFGSPHLAQKRALFGANVAAIAREAGLVGSRIHFKVFQYDVNTQNEEQMLLEAAAGSLAADFLLSNHSTISISVIQRPGAVSTFLREGVTPSSVSEYDLILILLDDVELPPDFSLVRARATALSRGVDIVALPVSDAGVGSPHALMRRQDVNLDGHVGRLVNMAELFVYILDPLSYSRYYDLLDPVSEWGWGVDFSLVPEGKLCLCLLDIFPVIHHYTGEAYAPAGRQREFIEYGKRHLLIQEPLELARF